MRSLRPRALALLLPLALSTAGCWRGFIDPERDPNGVVGAMFVPGGKLVESPPPIQNGSGPSVSGAGEAVSLRPGQTTTVGLTYLGASPYRGCVISVSGASRYIDLPPSGPTSSEGQISFELSIDETVGSGTFECVYGVVDDDGGVSNYVASTITFDNDASEDGGGAGLGGTCTSGSACGGTYQACVDGTASSCWYEAGGSRFNCSSCSSCTSAAEAVVSYLCGN